MSKVPSEIRGVLLPLQTGQLLLPNATVTEVVGYTPPESRNEDAPAWLLGTFSWRQQGVPLVSFETIAGSAIEPPEHRARIAICNTLNGNPDRPYIGILLKAIPHLVRVTRDTVAPIEQDEDAGSMVVEEVMISGQKAWIPDLDALDMALGDVLE
ncbi:chemotaxis protein CheW [Solemya velesiana gill symbiont]|uniref:CheW-like domain-containing protein n=1 Tax=Solemya velesiana gill symbiont TaxID=1918948 RepID=A0A1T2KW28_9GAMM|nr:chemotaxis protein CheW [Solemya velesiana gill symbiont]OOZ37022.1 hypothetical protein BOW51_04210 [Solemya velesiana gill symbiont]